MGCWSLVIYFGLLQTNIDLLLAMPMNDLDGSSLLRGSSSVHQTSANDCSSESINIDTLENQTNVDIDILQLTSSWQQKIDTKAHDEPTTPSSSGLNQIEIIFTISSTIVSQSIIAKRVYIIDAKNNQLLATIINNICLKNSSFIINYSTQKPLPHTVCLNLRLNRTSNLIREEIFFCRTLDGLMKNDSSSHESDSSHPVGPSQFFILSQCIIILIMMFIIFVVQTAREKNLMQRIRERLSRNRLYQTVFGHKPASHMDDSEMGRSALNPATTLQAGLNRLAFPRHLGSHVGHPNNVPLEEQVLAATDLTTAINDRMATRPFNSRDLLDVKELTKRMSVVEEHPTN